MNTRSLFLASAVALAVLGCRDEPTAPQTESMPQTERAARPIEGWFRIIWIDPAPGGGQPTVQYELVDERGHGTELDLDPAAATRWGGPQGLDRRKVRVEGHPVAGGRLRVRSIEPVGGATAAQAPGWGTVQTGPHPFVTILCKFSDVAAEPSTSSYIQWNTGTTYPSLDHYWRELSFNQLNVTGSQVVGWYTLPHPLAYYYTPTRWDANSAIHDCVAAADSDVDFPQFWGINLQFNASVGGSTGGSSTLTLDGETKGYGLTTLSSGNSMANYSHEEGHALGMMHSGSATGRGSWWDIMSSATPYGPQHTISYHKDVLGWIPAAQKLTMSPNSSRTITLDRLALPGSGSYLMAQIPMDNAPGQFYTVEARQRVGYDKYLPGDAVVLHQVDPNRQPWGPEAGGRDLLAQVVDADYNGNLNDAGAMWTPGETFTDSANAITVTVNAQTATGFQVTITRGTAGAWVSRASMPSARRALAVANANGLVYAIGGANGSGTVLRTVQAYNPATNSWTTKAALPAPRQGGNGAATLNGIVYVAGGEDAAGALTRTLYAYNATTNVWSTRAQMPAYGACGGSAVISGRLYVFSGCTRSSTGARINARLLHRYNPTTNSWATLKVAPVTHFRPAVAAIGGKLYVMGGENGSGTPLRRVDMYDPATNTWSTRTGMRTPRVNAGAIPYGGKLYVFGGRNGTPYLNSVEAYDPATNAWSSRPAMPTARAALGVSAAGGFLYAIGGRNTTAALATVERFTP